MKAILVMEMPENCINCPLNSSERCRVKPTVGITILPQRSRPQLCPLVPMPERDVPGVANEYNAGIREDWRQQLIDRFERVR